MTEILGKKSIEAHGYMEVLEMAIMKQVEEQLLARTFVGNATMKSSIIKAVGAGVGYAALGKGKHGRLLADAFLFDAAEDFTVGVVMPLIGGYLPGVGGGQTATNEWS